MSAPIEITCPIIDKIVDKLKQQLRECQRFNYLDNPQYVENILYECRYVMDEAIDKFEELRVSNDLLRKWGTEMEEEAKILQVQYNELEEKLNTPEQIQKAQKNWEAQTEDQRQ